MCVSVLSGVLRLEPHVHLNMRERAGACVNTAPVCVRGQGCDSSGTRSREPKLLFWFLLTRLSVSLASNPSASEEKHNTFLTVLSHFFSGI